VRARKAKAKKKKGIRRRLAPQTSNRPRAKEKDSRTELPFSLFFCLLAALLAVSSTVNQESWHRS